MNGDLGDRPFRPVLEALDLLLEPGAVAELRVIGTDGRIASGYFDDPALLAEKAEALDAAGEFSGCYVTLNPVHPALLARRANRVKTRLGPKDATTADADILRRRWLPIDIDPARPSGVSSTADEHAAACETARAIRDALAAAGWPAPIIADSGNGGHLLYRVDLPNDDESAALVKAVLAALDRRFSTERAKVDIANFNAARIWKCYGTVGRKGDSTRDRPHRRSAIVARPFALEVVPAALLVALVASAPPPDPPASPSAAPAPRLNGLDLGAWLAAHGIAVASEKPWRGGTLYTLATCPFSDAHADGAYAVQSGNGAVHAGCKHDSCGGGRQRWQELRARFEPGDAAPPASRAESEAASPPPDAAVVAAAKEVLETGDPVRYFLDCFAGDHVGDETLARCLIMSIASQTVRNTRGLHVYVTGESGKGKSDGYLAMLKQVPRSNRLAERMSNKALYYSDDINPGTVLLLDDIGLSEELQEVLKESTTRFTERIRMRTVDKNRKVQHCTIPERCAWWLANVSALYDEQVLNRMLVCWVDDSEAQDAEVFRRKLEEEARDPEETVEDRFALRVCREMWRRLRAEGLVFVRIPFARRIRMASVRNRRNADVLLDMIRAHALVHLFSRERRKLADGRPALVATEEDFRAATALFAELHEAGGSLTSKFDRSEQLVLSLASRYRAGEFTVADVQRWTGWNYRKARRILLGYPMRGVRLPGLLDKTPALSVEERMVAQADADGREVRRRLYVFAFNEERYRESRYTGQVWLEAEGATSDIGGRADGTRDVTDGARWNGTQPANGGDCVARGSTSTIIPDHRETPGAMDGVSSDAEDGALCSSPMMVLVRREKEERGENDERRAQGLAPSVTSFSGRDVPDGTRRTETAEAPPFAERPSAFRPRSVTSAMAPDRDDGIDPRQFTLVGDPAYEPCARCGSRPTFYREKRGERRLCRACFARMAERERRRCPPLPSVIDPAALHRATAEIGRCDVCGLAAASWTGYGTHLCDACYEREVRQGIGRGETPAEA